MKTRIVVYDGVFYPQWKGWFFWDYFWVDDGKFYHITSMSHPAAVKFDRLDQAVEFIQRQKHNGEVVYAE